MGGMFAASCPYTQGLLPLADHDCALDAFIGAILFVFVRWRLTAGLCGVVLREFGLWLHPHGH